MRDTDTIMTPDKWSRKTKVVVNEMIDLIIAIESLLAKSYYHVPDCANIQKKGLAADT
jgi:hypothetical protein